MRNIKNVRFIESILLLTILGGYLPLTSSAITDDENREATNGSNVVELETISQLIADNIELNMKNFASSVKALGDEYLNLYKTTPSMTKDDSDNWLADAKKEKNATIFHPYKVNIPTVYQAPMASFLYYKKGNPTEAAWRELKIFQALAPSFKVSFNTFNDSWVYMTTVNEAFMIYPYLPLAKAVNNFPPTKQIFYTAADFKNKTFGWTPPYLDLVGAGMMVTVCYPVYDNNQLLGVISRDITLSELSKQVLKPITETNGKLIGIIMDQHGLVIANSAPEAMDEIIKTNKKAGSALLYYREKNNLPAMPKAKNSKIAIYNQIGSTVLKQVQQEPTANAWTFNLTLNHQLVSVSIGKIPSTGWLVITFKINQ
jgi:methyl-accepting chemotaxis protein-like sensor